MGNNSKPMSIQADTTQFIRSLVERRYYREKSDFITASAILLLGNATFPCRVPKS